MECIHTYGRPLEDQEILAALSAQHPEKKFSIGPGGTIVESYREQPVYPERTSIVVDPTTKVELGNRAADAVALERMMSSEL